MNNRFFKKAAIKTMLHGLSAWSLLQIFYCLEQTATGDRETSSIVLLKYFMGNIAIPALATLGCENLMNKLFGTKIEPILASRNCIAAMFAPMLFPGMNVDFSMPLLLYTWAGLDYFECDLAKVAQHENVASFERDLVAEVERTLRPRVGEVNATKNTRFR